MNALTKIELAGFKVFLSGKAFGITPAKNLTTTQKEFLKLHKAKIITELIDRAERVIFPEKSEPSTIIVTCYTPSGKAIEIEAKNQEQADWLQKMNPSRLVYVE